MFFLISLSLYGISIPRKYSIFMLQLNLFHFIKICPRNREIGSLVVRPWGMTKNRETHGKTVRVGRSAQIMFPIHDRLYCFRGVVYQRLREMIVPFWVPSTFLANPVSFLRNSLFHQARHYWSLQLIQVPSDIRLIKIRHSDLLKSDIRHPTC